MNVVFQIEYELDTAHTRGKATAPGNDGITYDIIKFLRRVPGNPLLKLIFAVGQLPSS